MKYIASIVKYIKCIKHTHGVFYKLYKIIIYVQNINFKNVSKNIH